MSRFRTLPKSGYGNFPEYRVSPRPGIFIDYDSFFSKNFGKEVVLDKEGENPSVTFGVVRLPKLNTWEEK